jgi:hypothetical protein
MSDEQFDLEQVEPRVGEVYAVRTFRINTEDGALVPIGAMASEPRAWASAEATAVCARSARHSAPAEECTCGLYAFGRAEEVAAQYPQAREVLAIVACHGRIVTGTKGLRAQHARVVALWLGPGLPDDIPAKVADRYRQVPMYANKAAMLAEFPPTPLETYSDDLTGSTRRTAKTVVAKVVLSTLAVALAAVGCLGHRAGGGWPEATLLVTPLVWGAFTILARRGSKMARSIRPHLGMVGLVGFASAAAVLGSQQLALFVVLLLIPTLLWYLAPQLCRRLDLALSAPAYSGALYQPPSLRRPRRKPTQVPPVSTEG